VDIRKLEKFLEINNQPKFRLEQIRKAIYQDGVSSFLDISTIPKNLMEQLNREIKILSLEIEKILVSDDKKSIKALLKISCHSELNGVESKNLKKYKLDPSTGLGMTEYFIETVLLSPRPGIWTACISSQVGCPLNCAFCATGKNGFKRNLTAEEITDQVLFWKGCINNFQNSKFKIQNSTLSNIVYMGMGEPMLNWENVKKSLEDLINPKLFAIGSRGISVSTAGVPGGIEKLLADFPQVNLAISLHFIDPEARSQYMPVNKNYNLDDLKNDLKKYFVKSKRKVFLEYIMFEGINDSLDEADKVIKFIKSVCHSHLLHINLISYNETAGNDFIPASKNKILAFRNHLIQNKINVTIRKSLGSEIEGACGQLAGSFSNQ
jgi:23S rRNA (adenine(2503)-C(2))-methyltransferase